MSLSELITRFLTGAPVAAVATVALAAGSPRTGAFVHRFQSPGDPNTYNVTDLEVRANGSVAWVARIIQGMPATTTFEVRAFQAAKARSTILDSVAAIGSRSLALSGMTLYWTNDGAPRSTKLG